MRSENPTIRRSATGGAGQWTWRAIAFALALGTAPACWAQAQKAAAPAAGGPSDASVPGNERKDTKVLHPKDGETISVRLPKQGLLLISSLIPWAVTGEKQGHELSVRFDPRGIRIQHTGGSESDGTKASFTLRLIDGRTITVNVRTGNTKYKIGYAVIT
jgi:hypothetical protein